MTDAALSVITSAKTSLGGGDTAVIEQTDSANPAIEHVARSIEGDAHEMFLPFVPHICYKRKWDSWGCVTLVLLPVGVQ